MSKFAEKSVGGLSEVGLGLDQPVQRGARQVIQQAIEAELSLLLERFENVKPLHGQRAVVRNGYLPEREVLTAAGAIDLTCQCPPLTSRRCRLCRPRMIPLSPRRAITLDVMPKCYGTRARQRMSRLRAVLSSASTALR
jgi:hypothetical protein